MTIKLFRILASVALLTASASGAVLTGCSGPSIETFCNDQCLCHACTVRDFQKCVASGQEGQSLADQSGCSGPFDDALSCFHDNASCTTTPDKICDPEITALNTCLPSNVK
jgi:hypothetical protein